MRTSRALHFDENKEPKKIAEIKDPRKFYLDIGIIRQKSRNASRNIQRGLTEMDKLNGAVFKVQTSPTMMLFGDL